MSSITGGSNKKSGMTVFEYALISFMITAATLGAMVGLAIKFISLLAV